MKKTSLLLSLLLCGTIASNAQDTYWALQGNKVYNTATGAVTNHALHSDFDYNDDRSVIFNSSAEALFTGGNSSFFTVNNLGQVLAIPTVCKQFISLEIEPVWTPHGHILKKRNIDVTAVTNNNMTTGLPSVSAATTIYTGVDPQYYGTVAAKLNPDGTRFFYHLNVPASSATAYLYRYEIDNAGNVAPSPQLIANDLPYGTHMDIANDGSSIAYITSEGRFFTLSGLPAFGTPVPSLPNPSLVKTTYNTFSVNTSTEYPAMEHVIDNNGDDYWFIGNSSVGGHVREDYPNSFIDRTGGTGHGAATAFALGKDGNMYYAYGSAGAFGDLRSFDPSFVISLSSGLYLNSFSSPISGAQINVFDPTGSAYLFGNQVAGEDINAATGPTTPPTFTLAGQSSTASTSTDIVLCSGSTLTLNGQLLNLSNDYAIAVDEGTLNSSGDFVILGNTYDASSTSPDNSVSVDILSLFGGLSTYSGQIRVTLSATSPCGGTISKIMVFNIIHASAVVDFWMIGPKDPSTGSPVCIGHGGLPTPTFDGAQVRATTKGQVATSPGVITTGSTPPCLTGWLGASTAGIYKGTLTRNNTTVAATNGYKILVEEFDNSGGGTATKILEKYPSAFPASGFNFFTNTDIFLYFYLNYNTIKNNNYYKATLTVNTVECGPVSEEAWFRILADDVQFKPGSPTDISNLLSLEKLTVFPNPATDQVTISWGGTGAEPASIAMYNSMGQLVLKKQLDEKAGNNSQNIDISNLASGLYYYILHTGTEDIKGKLSVQ